ncbi:D-glycero-beta-D-manno-heptose-7-phosphate kinase [Shinella sp. CPCC 101442]|uniref:D-glycero-beta-D-manno-heptose-7-phosphate kinase n=1 Tax=Shinella sp. CPCC 101442 TaxID=2932265 RepID=UPI00215335DB|nr:D-glycero-beta-D-manno-heptose-7-phosphate kinase [Shinella sp. CPCC 101442]MCR6500845.1 D-glycero-beta-D-manno-heptose-7-phosphate kinase [Shinella sp. CPCC 101442]
MLNTMPILVVGDLMLDEYIEGSVDRISPEAPVPVLRKRNRRAVAGGAANVAANIAAMGGTPLLLGTVGSDESAEQLGDILKRYGVATDLLITDAERATTTKTRVVVGQQQIVRIDDEETHAISEATETLLLSAAIDALSRVRVLVLSDYAKGLLTDRVIRRLIAEAQSRGVKTIVDPKRPQLDIYGGADVIKPNRHEFEKAVGRPCSSDREIELAAELVTERFSSAFLVTRAEAGMTLIRPDAPPVHIHTHVKEVADVSGAGDTCLAALSLALSSGQDLETASRIANLAAGIAVSKLGTAVVTSEEIAAASADDNIHIHAGSCVDVATAKLIVDRWRLGGDDIVFTNGCFDIIHPGHIHILESAAKEGTRLVVGLNTDRSVSSLKGPTRPVQTEDNRARVLGALRFVDLVILFDEETPLQLIQKIRPTVVVKGADYREDEVVGGDLVKAAGGRVVLVPLIEGQSSSKLIVRASMGKAP